MPKFVIHSSGEGLVELPLLAGSRWLPFFFFPLPPINVSSPSTVSLIILKSCFANSLNLHEKIKQIDLELVVEILGLMMRILALVVARLTF